MSSPSRTVWQTRLLRSICEANGRKGEQSAVDGPARRMSAGDQGGVTVRGGEGSERVETDGVVGYHIQRDLGEVTALPPPRKTTPTCSCRLGLSGQ